VLHARLVVDDHVRVVLRRLVEVAPEHAVHEAVTAGAFGPAHGQQVEAALLDDRLLDAVLDEAVLGHPAGDLVLLVEGLLAEVRHRGPHVHAEHRA